jgi:predicted enzyme related to lactoylglutathione lyase
MANNLKHFAVHADDVDRARSFYEKTFGWHVTPWGPPGFFLIKTLIVLFLAALAPSRLRFPST